MALSHRIHCFSDPGPGDDPMDDVVAEPSPKDSEEGVEPINPLKEAGASLLLLGLLRAVKTELGKDVRLRRGSKACIIAGQVEDRRLEVLCLGI